MARAVLVMACRGVQVEDVVGRRRTIVIVWADGALCRAFVGGRVGVADETSELVAEVHAGVTAAASTRTVVWWGELSERFGNREIRRGRDEEVVGVEGAVAVRRGPVAARGRRGRRGWEMKALLSVRFVV